MSQQDYDEAVRLIEANEELQDFVGRQSFEIIEKAEIALNFRFSPLYRSFLQTYGAGNFGGFEIYGITSDNFDSASIPNGIWFTLRERRIGNVPEDYIIIGADGMGGLICLKALSNSWMESEVFVIEPGEPTGTQELLAQDFGTFLLQGI